MRLLSYLCRCNLLTHRMAAYLLLHTNSTFPALPELPPLRDPEQLQGCGWAEVSLCRYGVFAAHAGEGLKCKCVSLCCNISNSINTVWVENISQCHGASALWLVRTGMLSDCYAILHKVSPVLSLYDFCSGIIFPLKHIYSMCFSRQIIRFGRKNGNTSAVKM